MKFTLKGARVNKELTQAAAAKALGTTPQTLSTYECYKVSPDARTIVKMLALYGLAFDQITWIKDKENVQQPQPQPHLTDHSKGPSQGLE